MQANTEQANTEQAGSEQAGSEQAGGEQRGSEQGVAQHSVKSQTRRAVRILVTGGGTGGHVTPALATVRAVQEVASAEGWTPEFLYVGSLAGVEQSMAAAAGIPFAGVQTGKLRRAARWYGMINAKNLSDLLRVPVGVFQAARHVWKFKPDAVLATGGYVAVPPVIAAAFKRVPILIHEQTVQIGLANRINAPLARRIALSSEDALPLLKPSLRPRAVVTGNPVREVIFSGDRASAPRRFGFAEADDHLPAIYVTGGALGARVLNRAVEGALNELLRETRIIHQCGQQPAGSEQDYDRLVKAAEALPEDLRRRYHLTRFVREEIGDVFALCDLVVGRSGAGTVTEVCAVGKAAIYVPLVPTGGDEQTKNARRAADAGAAKVVPSAEFDSARLIAEALPLVRDPAALRAMGEAARSLARPDAARDLARVLLNMV
jgi:UDP-N-acetylglucosamine--N-acetylmuramyl-(pentapeptide) pyrophosphoryl-undecaprenol N-acetylglucosamine transferase